MALVDTSALPAARLRALASGWLLMRTASVVRPPVIQAGAVARALTIQVVG